MKKNLIIHPWLFALIPIIGFFEHNQDIASAYYLPKPIILALSISIILFFTLNAFIKNKYKSATIVSIFIISFFLFDLLSVLFLEMSYVIPYGLIPYELLSLISYIIIIIALGFLIAKSNNKLDNINKILNFFAITVIILQLFSIANYQYQHKSNIVKKVQDQSTQSINTKISPTENATFPDIYYIILDGYARADILKNIYNHDNSHFINFLKEKGFYVAENSHSNYNQTFLSMSSSLNLDYLDKLIVIPDHDSADRSLLKKILRDNLVYDFLKAKNYTVTSISSLWVGIDKNIKYDINLTGDLKQNSFESMLIRQTPLALFFNELQRQSIATHLSTALDKIPEIANIKEPTFNYIHILSPHPSFIFEADGSIVDKSIYCEGVKDGSHYFEVCPGVEEYRKRYINQLSYLNKRFEYIINEILEKSETPPIIILQSDHGPGSMLDWDSAENTNMPERLSILNAYYVPEETKKMLYPSISPVNSFRIIFNSVFNSQFEILEDKSYFATWYKPYDFIDVSEEIK